MRSVPQMKGLLKLKDEDGDSLLVNATFSDNTVVMFDAVLNFVEHHLSLQEVI